MSGNIYTLYKSHCENVGKYRGIEISGVVSSVEISKVESRATLLTLLDLVLHEHRKKFGTPYNQLNGKKALVHLILMKHHWMPKQINEMKFDELLLSIQDELTLDKISVTAQKFLDYRDLPSTRKFPHLCIRARRFWVLFCAFHTSSSYQLLVDGDQIVKELSVL